MNVVMPKNFVGGTVAPVAFSIRASAFGPWISKRYSFGSPSRTTEEASRSNDTS